MSLSNTLTVNVETGEVLSPVTPNVAREVNRNPRTIKRWIADKTHNFPTPIRIKGRLYLTRSAFEQWKAGLVSAALNGEVA
jgi:hypothetical protein